MCSSATSPPLLVEAATPAGRVGAVGIGSLGGTERQINRELEKTGPGKKRRTFGPNSLSFAVAPAASPLAPTVLLAPNLTMPAVALGTGEYKGDACVGRRQPLR